MPVIISDEDIANIVKLYTAGMTLTDVSKSVGVNIKTANKYLSERGVTKRTKRESARIGGIKLRGRKRPCLHKPMPPEVIQLYRSGMSLRDISARFGKCRKQISEYLRLNGVEVSRHNTIIKKFGRNAQSCWANNASSIAATKPVNRESRARARAGRGHIGIMETEFCQELERCGFDIVHQRPVGAYNVDIAIDEFHIAIEVERGSWYGSASAKPERIKYLLDAGWALVFVRIGRSGAAINVTAICNQLIALSETIRVDPSARGQYGVLCRNGKPATRLPDYLNDFPRIVGL